MLNEIIENFNYWRYLFYIIMSALICMFYIIKVFQSLKQKSIDSVIFTIILSHFKQSIVLLILVLAAYHGLELILYNSEANSGILLIIKQIFPILFDIKNVSIIVIIAWYFLQVLRAAQQYFVQKDPSIKSVFIITKVLQVTIISIAGLLIVEKLGLNISGIITFGGIGGIAAGLAAKDLLSNFFGSLVVTLDKPFVRGDKIAIPDKKISGFVVDIGWRITKLMTYEKRPIYIPNSLFSTVIVQNDSRMSHRRINEVIRVRFEKVGIIDKIISEIDSMMRENIEIDQMQTILVNLESIGSKIFTILIYAFTKGTDWDQYRKARQNIMIEVTKIAHGFDTSLILPEAIIEVYEEKYDVISDAMQGHLTKNSAKVT